MFRFKMAVWIVAGLLMAGARTGAAQFGGAAAEAARRDRTSEFERREAETRQLRVDVTAEAVQPAGYPVVLSLVMTNTAKTPFTYWCGSPELYPGAHLFVVRVMDAKGAETPVLPENGQYTLGSGVDQEIKPGETVEVPAALDPLPAGRYSIHVGAGKAATVTVEQNAELGLKREQDVVRQIRAGREFGRFLSYKYPREAVTRQLVQDLAADDAGAAFVAARALFAQRTLPEGTGATIAAAMTKQLAAKPSNGNLLVYLAILAANIGTDEARAPVLALAKSDEYDEVRMHAVESLATFKQPEASAELRGLLKEWEPRVRLAAAAALAARGDATAIEVLVGVAQDKTSQWRGDALRPLANFPDDPRAETTIRKGLDDEDRNVRESAKDALEVLARNRKAGH